MTDQIDYARLMEAPDTGPGNTAAEDHHTRAPFLAHAADVLNDRMLSMEQKRSTLAAWLSDAHAVPDAPRWRQLENGAFVDSYELWAALRMLDEMEEGARSSGLRASSSPFDRRKRQEKRLGTFVRRNRNDDEDDPPPSPVAVGRPTPPPIDRNMGAELAVAA